MPVTPSSVVTSSRMLTMPRRPPKAQSSSSRKGTATGVARSPVIRMRMTSNSGDDGGFTGGGGQRFTAGGRDEDRVGHDVVGRLLVENPGQHVEGHTLLDDKVAALSDTDHGTAADPAGRESDPHQIPAVVPPVAGVP